MTVNIQSLINASLNRGDKGEKGAVGAKGAYLVSATYTTANDTITFVDSESHVFVASGMKGQKGDVEAQGSKGQKGELGDKGEIGPTGTKGVAGADGTNGIDGTKGDKGDTGTKGIKGEVGGITTLAPQTATIYTPGALATGNTGLYKWYPFVPITINKFVGRVDTAGTSNVVVDIKKNDVLLTQLTISGTTPNTLEEAYEILGTDFLTAEVSNNGFFAQDMYVTFVYTADY